MIAFVHIAILALVIALPVSLVGLLVYYFIRSRQAK